MHIRKNLDSIDPVHNQLTYIRQIGNTENPICI